MNKKLLLFAFPILLLLVACTMTNTPTSKVEDLFTKYQTLDNDIDSAIESILDEQNLSSTRKDRYRMILEKQYKNLTYQIKDEIIDGNTATVITEIEVLDLKKSIDNLTYDNNLYPTKDEYDEEKLNRLEQAKDKVKYTLELTLTKDDNSNWTLNALTNEDIKKIQGMY